MRVVALNYVAMVDVQKPPKCKNELKCFDINVKWTYEKITSCKCIVVLSMYHLKSNKLSILEVIDILCCICCKMFNFGTILDHRLLLKGNITECKQKSWNVENWENYLSHVAFKLPSNYHCAIKFWKQPRSFDNVMLHK